MYICIFKLIALIEWPILMIFYHCNKQMWLTKLYTMTHEMNNLYLHCHNWYNLALIYNFNVHVYVITRHK